MDMLCGISLSQSSFSLTPFLDEEEEEEGDRHRPVPRNSTPVI
jgi:hypothetical protein